MIPIVTPTEMAAVDAAAPEPVEVLVERAGSAVARAALDLLGGAYGRRVVVVAGKGNNGADGRSAARRLERRGVRTLVLPAASLPAVLPAADLVIDAAYGTGFHGAWEPPRLADPSTPVLAVDIPSGVTGATGIAGGDVLQAVRTVTFAALKPGLLIGDGPRLAGEVLVVDIGLDVDQPVPPKAWLVEPRDVAGWLPIRPATSHKWKAAVRLVAGSPGMTGAAELAAEAAMRAGAGYVRRSTPGLDPAAFGAATPHPVEAVTTPLPLEGWAHEVLADIDRFGCLAVGPGLGVGPVIEREVRLMMRAPLPIVVDGDGLRALGDDPGGCLAGRPDGLPPVVLTPHDAEFTRLGGNLGGADSRIDAVRSLADRTGAVVLLKGPVTLVAHPDGRVMATDAGDERLATAGTGDVLTGMLSALLARGMNPLEAAVSAAFLHGRAARRSPRSGFVAGDLPPLLVGNGDEVGHPIGEDGHPMIRRFPHG